MRKQCDSTSLFCEHNGRLVKMTIAVNFNGKIRTYCCEKCANDDIEESSHGDDNIFNAITQDDVFSLRDINLSHAGVVRLACSNGLTTKN